MDLLKSQRQSRGERLSVMNPSYHHPVVRVLSINVPAEAKVSKIPKWIRGYKFASFEDAILIGLDRQFQSVGVQKDFFLSMEGKFVFEHILVAKCYNFLEKGSLSLDQISVFLLRSSLAWLSVFVESNDIKYFGLVMKVLAACKRSQKYAGEASGMFQVLCGFVAERAKGDAFGTVTSSVDIFFRTLKDEVNDPLVVKVLATLMGKAIKEGNDTLGLAYFNLIASFKQTLPWVLTDAVKELLAESITGVFRSFDKTTFLLIEEVLNVSDAIGSEKLFAGIFRSIMKRASEREPFYKMFPARDDVVYVPMVEAMPISFAWKKEAMFEACDGDVDNMHTQLDSNSVTTLPDFQGISEEIARIASRRGLAGVMIKAAATVTAESVSEKNFMDLASLVVNLDTVVGPSCPCDCLVTCLFSTRLFGAQYSLEDVGENKWLLLRYPVFKLMLNSGPSGYDVILCNFIQYPVILKEIMYVFASKADSSYFAEPKFVAFLKRIAFMYRELDGICPEYRQEIAKVRSIVWHLILTGVSDNAAMLLDSQEFAQAFIVYGLEDKKCMIVIECIRKILDGGDMIPQTAVNAITDALAQAEPTESELQLWGNFISLANHTLDMYPKSRACFKGLVEELCGFAIRVKAKKQTADYSGHFLSQVFALYRRVLSAGNADKSPGSGEAISESDFSDMARLSLADETGLVVRPMVCVPLVKVFKKTPLIFSEIRFLADLCRKSEDNAKACREGDLDLYILTLLNKRKGEQCDELVDEGLSLITVIGRVCSSLSVVYAFIALFTPCSGQELSQYHYRFVSAMESFMINPIERACSFAMVGRSHTLPVTGKLVRPLILDTPVSWFQSPLTITFTLLTVEPTKHCFLTFKDQRDNCLSISIDETNCLLIKSSLGDCVALAVDIPIGRAFDLAVTIARCDGTAGSSVSISVDKRIYDAIRIGTVSFTGEMVTTRVYRGVRGQAYHMTIIQMSHGKRILMGVKINAKPKAKKQSKIGGSVVFRKQTDMKFVDILTALCSVDILLPLFPLLDLTIRGEGQSHDPVKLVRIVSAFLGRSERAEIKCRRGYGFAALSFILSSVEQVHLTVELYKALVDLFKRLTVTEVKRDLCIHVLAAFAIWSRAVSSEVTKVVEVLCEFLIGNGVPQLMVAVGFQWLVFSLSRFFPLDNIQHHNLKTLEKVRSTMIETALLCFAKYTDSEKHLRFIVGMLLRVGDWREKYDLLLLLKRLVMDVSRKWTLPWEHAMQLHHLLVDEADEVVMLVIDIFVLMHERKLFTGSLSDLSLHISIMSDFLIHPRSCVFMSHLIKIAKIHPEFTPQCFYQTYIGGPEHQQLMESEFGTEALSNAGLSCISWMMRCLTSIRGDFAKFVMRMLSYTNVNVYRLFVFGTLSAQLENVDVREVQDIFMKYVNVFDSDERGLEIADVMIYMIMKRDVRYSRRDLGGSGDVVNFEKSDGKCKKERVKYGLERLSASGGATRFGLHFEASGIWVDQDLAAMCVERIAHLNLKKYENTAGVLVYFLRRCGREVERPTGPLADPVESLLNGTSTSDSWYDVVEAEIAHIDIHVSDVQMEIIQEMGQTFDTTQQEMKTLWSRTSRGSCGTEQTRSYRSLGLDVENMKHESRKAWFHLWERLCFDGPWKSEATGVSNERHWKRDATLCYCGYPAKLKRNRNFSDHMPKQGPAPEEAECGAIMKKHDSLPLLSAIAGSKSRRFTEEAIDSSQIICEWKAIIMKLDCEKKCTVALFNDRIVLKIIETDRIRTFVASQIKMILCRGILHMQYGIEIFPRGGPSVLLNFKANSLEILRMIAKAEGFHSVVIQTVPSMEFMKSLTITEQWSRREISTFEYIMQLNTFSGRTFNDCCMYPVFPWVIRDYDSEKIDINERSVYRDLAKPMGAIDENRLQSLKVRDRPGGNRQATDYLYGSCYSSPLWIYIWLVREEPFTTLHIDAQSGRFDHAHRLFSSIGGAYNLSSSGRDDYRELIPEFFFTPTFLLNTNRFNLGTLEGRKLDNAELPKWANNAMEFIYLNRKALESENASEMIADWIDLIWGFKQNGKEAESSDNVFMPYHYESIWSPEQALTKDKEEAVKMTLKSCGQIPSQLFDERHVKREKLNIPRLSKQIIMARDITKPVSVFASENKIVCSAKGHIYSFAISSKGNELRITDKNRWKIELPEWKSADIVSSTCIVFLFNDNTVGAASPSLISEIPVDQESGEIKCVSASSDFVVSGGCDCAISIFRNAEDSSFIRGFSSFHGEVVCCGVSESYDLAVVGARDGALFFISLSRRTITLVVTLDCKRPNMLKITSGWGFVVVYEQEINGPRHFVELFDVNGASIRIVEVGFKINCWSTWKSMDGFDYMIVHAGKRGIYACELFYLDFKVVDASFTSAESLCYCPINCTALVVEKGQIWMVPFVFDELC